MGPSAITSILIRSRHKGSDTDKEEKTQRRPREGVGRGWGNAARNREEPLKLEAARMESALGPLEGAQPY